MKRCSDDCVPVCDFCIYYTFKTTYCSLYSVEKDPIDKCSRFHCFRAAKKGGENDRKTTEDSENLGRGV